MEKEYFKKAVSALADEYMEAFYAMTEGESISILPSANRLSFSVDDFNANYVDAPPLGHVPVPGDGTRSRRGAVRTGDLRGEAAEDHEAGRTDRRQEKRAVVETQGNRRRIGRIQEAAPP